jgi:hypothetical protein
LVRLAGQAAAEAFVGRASRRLEDLQRLQDQRQADGEGRVADLALDGDQPAVLLDDMPGSGEADATAADRASRV